MNRRRVLQTGTFVGASSGMRREGAGAACDGTDSDMQIRIARPTDKLNQVVAFYRDALGLAIIGHFEESCRIFWRHAWSAERAIPSGIYAL